MKTLATALGAAVAALALVLPAAPAQAATYRYDITLAADTLGPGGVFGITALPAPAAHGHVSFDADPQAQDLSYANVVDFVLQVGQQSFTLEDLAAALFDFQPGQVGGPLTGAFFIGSTADRAFFHLDTMNGWYAGADVLAGGCDFGVADAACIGGGVPSISFTQHVPEPGAVALLALALMLAGGVSRRRLHC